MEERYPAVEGFYMPAEWTDHRRCWMAWPCRLERWGAHYDMACVAYAAIARAIAAFEPVSMLTPSALVPVATLQLGRKVTVVPAELDDSLSRDCGPTFLRGEGGAVAGVVWRFNGWGNRWHPYDKDDTLADALLDELSLPAFGAPIVLEGGAIETDGAGTVILTEPTILDDKRNPTLDPRQIEERLALYLGARKIIWLRGGLRDDYNDGHVGDVARFAGPGRVLCAVSDAADDGDGDTLRENLDRLKSETDAFGHALQVIETPLPLSRTQPSGRRAGISYLSFYAGNKAVFVPSFRDPNDEAAARIIAEALAPRDLVVLPAQDLTPGGVSLRSMTLPEPRGEGPQQ